MSPASELRKVAEADFPTRFGQFRIYGFSYTAGEETEKLWLSAWAIWSMGDRRWCGSIHSA